MTLATTNMRRSLRGSAPLTALLILLTSGPFHARAETSDRDRTAIAQVTFTATDAELANPERGFYRAASTDLDALSAVEVANAYTDGYRLIYARINLAAYRNADLPQSYLKKIETGFATARRGGIKLIVRATYNYPNGETEYHDAQDAPIARVKDHLAQLKPVLRRNADVIAFVQAGFIGAWGEWHTSSNDLTSPENRDQIKAALLDAVPDTRFIQFRYPPYIRDWSPRLPPLTAALNGTFRFGFHNDCFLASQTDVGTYDEAPASRAEQQTFTDELGDLGPFGGETCNPADDPNAKPRTTCNDILSEGARYNLTYLNDGYYRRLFHDNWIKEGCMTDVRRRMGYRIALVSATHPTTASRGGAFSISIVVRNSGWARIYNPRAVEIVLRDPISGAVHRITSHSVDPRQWLPNVDSAATLDITLPDDLPTGAQEIWLALPDADTSLAKDARFAIRFANADDAVKKQQWNSSLGAFSLGTKVEIR
ncbi:hypothetical protein AEAC466_05150 [Asticcacaulis sp. AC466]|uniref:DUF4832 domain-containing protein n=1 Tax=Asticcacaulis sp. AC466 TaxID=1282362 RepID=UPI0003C3D963|nr:DUF4832 domain-containing protein [Asticcacaulis sp. AC466]ESQ85098.1 hypothetical protein AEAC466_05150 [Asticcacaulis sp. AC466]